VDRWSKERCVVVNEVLVEEYMEGISGVSAAAQFQTVGEAISLSSESPLSPKVTD